MADYIYLLDKRLSPAQKQAISVLREIARGKSSTLFLVGGAVRDLTSGSPVRDLDVATQGNPIKWRKDLESAGAVVVGLNDAGQALYLRFPGGVRVEVGSTLSAHYPKPNKPILKPGTILEDLRRRDFTANAMALSLNEGSYGLLMDPLNGVADIENRELRLVSNYGFIEEPVRLIRAIRFTARLGWTLEEKTQSRYDTGKQEGYISGLQEFHRGYEAEEIAHEEDPLRVMKRLEVEGWMQAVAPAWSASKASVAELDRVRESQTQLQLQGIHPDSASVIFPLLTAKMTAKEIDVLKKSFPRPGFVAEIDALEGEGKEFAGALSSKAAASASSSYRLIHGAKPEVVLYVAYTTKSSALQAKFKSFFGEWPESRQKLPMALMLEMRITSELPGYHDLLEKIYFELMDGHLVTLEEMRAFLEPYSPPAPPPPVNVRRPRAARKDAKKGRMKKGVSVALEDADDLDEDDLDDSSSDPEEDDDADEVESLHGGAAFGITSDHAAAGEEEEDTDEEYKTPALSKKTDAISREAIDKDEDSLAKGKKSTVKAKPPSKERIAPRDASESSHLLVDSAAEDTAKGPSDVGKSQAATRNSASNKTVGKSSAKVDTAPIRATAPKAIAVRVPTKPLPTKVTITESHKRAAAKSDAATGTKRTGATASLAAKANTTKAKGEQ